MIFPNRIEAEAEFLVHSQTIHLKKIYRTEFAECLNARDYEKICKPLSVLVHELTHWFDTTSTLWGQKYLYELYDVYYYTILHTKGVGSQREFGEIESEWWRAIKLDCEDSRILFPKYYKEYYKNEKDKFTYGAVNITYSCGVEFSIDGKVNYKKPIFFVRLLDENNLSIARIPLTVGALLESSAVCAELLSRCASIDKISQPHAKIIEKRKLHEELDYLLSSCGLVDYTVARHMVMKENNVSDILDSYLISSIISFICLNLSDNYFDRIIPPATLHFIPNDRIESFKKNRDRTFVFACLCIGCGKFSGDMSKIYSFIDSGLSVIGLPPYASIIKQSYISMLNIRDSIYHRCPTDKTLSYILSVGRSNFLKRSEENIPTNTMSLMCGNATLPKFFDAEQEIFNFGSNSLNENYFNYEYMYFLDLDINVFIGKLRDACKI
ncbi:hypothetical protein [Acetobacter lovaniensis]|jgi:hypothetical protein|uniref:Uncharacterized protein n=1 Tax=Acetobacter lovaniensis TaxID=104100 RepID=A0A841QGB1_9PROT|nr:hypothetical protein [Acetobacter lovaniensis]MBB6458079.1 hypothetical protein [Acetobacter lovaniensis]MCP1240586.1 hypothetical protein [Acetobacter lovaniensis]NHN82381.1 hypothetical protein [Acetobacter lovaniensis]GBQ74413.1 hypothetical protein AA0474_3220 [Acetobacter lovaniensis NRIC 0474]